MITECRKFESYTVKLDIYSFHNFNIHPDTNAFDWYELKKKADLLFVRMWNPSLGGGHWIEKIYTPTEQSDSENGL